MLYQVGQDKQMFKKVINVWRSKIRKLLLWNKNKIKPEVTHSTQVTQTSKKNIKTILQA